MPELKRVGQNHLTSRPDWKAALKASLPIRSNPLIPILSGELKTGEGGEGGVSSLGISSGSCSGSGEGSFCRGQNLS